MKNSQDIIIGIHSIKAALENPRRTLIKLLYTSDSQSELEKSGIKVKSLGIECQRLSPHDFQEQAKKIYDTHSFRYSRIPSQALLVAEPLELVDVHWLYQVVKDGKLKRIIALDQVTDIQNGAAILRSACFYGVDALLISGKNAFGLSPAFYRVASGACEYLPIVQVNNLAKTITKLRELGVVTVGLSEHENADYELRNIVRLAPSLLVLGSEQKGLSYAVARVVEYQLALNAQGPIKSLNVAAASAIAMEKAFGD